MPMDKNELIGILSGSRLISNGHWEPRDIVNKGPIRDPESDNNLTNLRFPLKLET